MTIESSAAATDAAVRQVIEQRVKAIHDKDVDALLTTIEPSVVTFNLAPPLQVSGHDREGLNKWFAGYDGPIDYEIRDLGIVGGETVAFCHYLYHVRGTLTDGQRVDMWVRATMGLRKTGGAWKIVHEHHSEPFDMQTFQARLDLEP
jgi:PhnB protein